MPGYHRAVPTQNDVRRICESFGDTTLDPRGFGFRRGDKLFAWVWMQRLDPKKKRLPNPDVLVVHTDDEFAKQDLLMLDPDVFFTEPHYDGYPAVLVRLAQIEPDLLELILRQAWESRAPKGRRQQEVGRG